MSLEPITNFKDSNGVDLGTKLITKDYLISVYPEIGDKIGIPPELWVWGSNASGALGNGSTSGSISTPVTTFAGGTNWRQVEVGVNNIAAIKTDGTLWTWGFAGNGVLGNAGTTNRSTPSTTFTGGTNWKQVSCSNVNVAAIKTDGTLWIWGGVSVGKLGNATVTTNRSTPITTFAGGTNWKQVSVGDSHVAAIKTDGTLWVWGAGTNGRLGNADIADTVSTPVTTFTGGNNWKQVSCGERHTSAIKTDGTLWTWGYGSGGRLGTNDSTPDRSTPVTTFAGETNWKQVSVGDSHVAAIKTDGTLWVWGAATNGRLGNRGFTGNIFTPVTTFTGGTNWKQVSCSYKSTAAIKTDGTLWTWGYGLSGRLGNANVSSTTSTPITTFAGGTNWKQVSFKGIFQSSNAAAIRSVDF